MHIPFNIYDDIQRNSHKNTDGTVYVYMWNDQRVYIYNNNSLPNQSLISFQWEKGDYNIFLRLKDDWNWTEMYCN